MKKSIIKYCIISVFLLIFLNRALLFTPYEVDNNGTEINSVLELVIHYLTGYNNGIDEDGDSQESCNVVKTIHPVFSMQFLQNIDFQNKYSIYKDKFLFPFKENIPVNPFLEKIYHPPQFS